MPTVELNEWLPAAGLFALFVVGAVLARTIVHAILAKSFDNSSDIRRALSKLTSLVFWALLLFGLNQATQTLTYVREHKALAIWIERALAIAWILLAVIFISKFFGAWLQYQERLGNEENQAELRDRNSLFRKLFTGTLVIIGALMALRVAGADISPFLAGGAVGGIVLGLALQESLGNVFAGLFLNADRSIRIGDLVRLESNKEGFVEHIGWRNTQIRLWDQTLLVIPNNQFSKQSYINLAQTSLDTMVNVDCSVEYGSDLGRIEALVLQVATEVQMSFADAETTVDPPFVRWREFGDSGMIFRTFIPIPDSLAQYRIKSDFVKRLHVEFEKQGIKIPYPKRVMIQP